MGWRATCSRTEVEPISANFEIFQSDRFPGGNSWWFEKGGLRLFLAERLWPPLFQPFVQELSEHGLQITVCESPGFAAESKRCGKTTFSGCTQFNCTLPLHFRWKYYFYQVWLVVEGYYRAIIDYHDPPPRKGNENMEGMVKTLFGESSRGNTIRGNRTESLWEEICLWEGLWEDLWKPLKKLSKPLKTSENLWKPLKTSQKPLKNLWKPSSQRPSQRPSQRQISSQRLSVLLPLLVLPLKLSPNYGVVTHYLSPRRKNCNVLSMLRAHVLEGPPDPVETSRNQGNLGTVGGVQEVSNFCPWPICRNVLEDFCCINFGGFSRGFSWRIFLGTFSHKNEEKNPAKKSAKKSGGSKIKIREKSVLPKAGPNKFKRSIKKTQQSWLKCGYNRVDIPWTLVGL